MRTMSWNGGEVEVVGLVVVDDGVEAGTMTWTTCSATEAAMVST